ncbi:MAG: hypothetical protein JO144_17495 [Actinobacteria bacterium]|nr:hypothetical protein [Actinomycetota bacterium]
MPNIPTPIRAALGLAATAVDEARRLPETLPQAVSTVPLRAVSTAMQASLKLQQHLATLSARGDEVLSQLRGRSAGPPNWATFDDSPAHTGAVDPHAGESAKAAFDRIDYDSTGFAESASDEDGRDRWDAVGVGGAPEADLDGLDGLDLDLALPGVTDQGTAPAPSTARPTPPAPSLADAVSSPELPASAKAPAKAAKKAVKAGPIKASPVKAGPAKAKRAGRKAEPLEVAASKAPSDGTPTPSTMAAEILHAHEDDAGTE